MFESLTGIREYHEVRNRLVFSKTNIKFDFLSERIERLNPLLWDMAQRVGSLSILREGDFNLSTDTSRILDHWQEGCVIEMAGIDQFYPELRVIGATLEQELFPIRVSCSLRATSERSPLLAAELNHVDRIIVQIHGQQPFFVWSDLPQDLRRGYSAADIEALIYGQIPSTVRTLHPGQTMFVPQGVVVCQSEAVESTHLSFVLHAASDERALR